MASRVGANPAYQPPPPWPRPLGRQRVEALGQGRKGGDRRVRPPIGSARLPIRTARMPRAEGPFAERQERAESGPSGAASGRTAVRTKAPVPL
jgi:hypothetical protein